MIFLAQPSNGEHVKLLKQMGISMISLPDGRVQLLHSTADAESAEAAAEGLEFMQDVLAGVASSSSSSSRPENVPQTVSWASTKDESQITVQSATAGPAQFGKVLTKDDMVSSVLPWREFLAQCAAPSWN